MRQKFKAIGLMILCGLCVFAHAADQPYPAKKPVTIIVPYPAGGPYDTVARIIAQRIGPRLKQTFIVENKPGAGGVIGAEVVARSAPDGYTLMVQGNSHTITPSLLKISYDAVKSFAPITLIGRTPFLLIVNPSVQAKTVKELVDLAKKQPGEMTYASFGNATSAHLAMVEFQAATGISLVHVPYKGSAPAMNDILAGHVPTMFDNIITSTQHVKAGKLRALAVTSAKRSPLLPDVPTMAEAGVRGFEPAVWFGLFAPAGTDPKITALLNQEVVAALKDPVVKERFHSMGAEIIGSTPEQFKSMLESEVTKWAAIVKANNIKLD